MKLPLPATGPPPLRIEDRRVLMSALAAESKRLLHCLEEGEFAVVDQPERERLLALLRDTNAEFRRLISFAKGP